MADFAQISLRVLDYATRPARFAVGTLLRFVRDDEPELVPEPTAATATAATPPQTRPEPAASAPSPKAARRAARHEPTKGQAAAIREARREEEWDHAGPGANVVIDDRLKP